MVLRWCPVLFHPGSSADLWLGRARASPHHCGKPAPALHWCRGWSSAASRGGEDRGWGPGHANRWQESILDDLPDWRKGFSSLSGWSPPRPPFYVYSHNSLDFIPAICFLQIQSSPRWRRPCRWPLQQLHPRTPFLRNKRSHEAWSYPPLPPCPPASPSIRSATLLVTLLNITCKSSDVLYKHKKNI